MQTVTKYKAQDGREFLSKEDCVLYETNLERVKEIFAPLGSEPKDDGCKFANGGGYIQHSLDAINKIADEFHLFATNWLNQRNIDYISSSEWLKWHDISERPKAMQEAREKTYDKVFIGRYLDDGNSPLYAYWSRLQCIDSLGKEWGQPYYALNPSQGKQHDAESFFLPIIQRLREQLKSKQ